MSALVPTWGWYAAARFVVGVGFGANMVINCVYPLEFVGRQWRVLCGTIGFWSPALVVLPGLVSTTRYLQLHCTKRSSKINVYLKFSLIFPISFCGNFLQASQKLSETMAEKTIFATISILSR